MSVCVGCKNIKSCNYMFPNPPPPCAVSQDEVQLTVKQLQYKISALIMSDKEIEGLWLSGLRSALQNINYELKELLTLKQLKD